MPRPIEALIHPAHLSHNLGVARARAGGARVWAVVKANAYGHGIARCFDALRQVADGFACLDLSEAELLRSLDWRGPILLLEGVFEPRDLELCSRLHLWHVIHCAQQIDWLAAHKLQVIEDKLADLKAMRKALTALLRQCETGATQGNCPIIHALAAD